MRAALLLVLLVTPAWADEATFEDRTAAEWAKRIGEHRSAADALARGGKAAIPVVKEILRAAREGVRTRVIESLEKKGDAALASIGWEVLAALPPESDTARRVAAIVLDEGVRRLASAPEHYRIVLKPAVIAKPESVALAWESGSGHGFTLSLYSAKWAADGLHVRKLRRFWERPRREGEQPVEGVTIESTVMPRGRARAVLRMLFAATGLRLERVPTNSMRYHLSSSNFHRSLEIRSDRPLFSGSFTGYSSTTNGPKYVHLNACNALLGEALETCTWRRELPTPADLAALALRLDRIDDDSWWVAERLLKVALAIGDGRCLPALERYIKKQPDKTPRDHRYAIDAYARISGLDLRPNSFHDKDVAATRAQYLAAFAK